MVRASGPETALICGPMSVRQSRVERRNPPHRRPQAMHAAGIGRIADRARDIGAVGDMPDAGRDRGARTTGGAARRDGGIARVPGVAMDQIGGEPAIGKCRAVGPSENHRAGLAQIVDHRTVGLGDHVTLQLEAIGGGKALLVDIDLDRDRHPGQGAHWSSPRAIAASMASACASTSAGRWSITALIFGLTASSRASAAVAASLAETSFDLISWPGPRPTDAKDLPCETPFDGRLCSVTPMARKAAGPPRDSAETRDEIGKIGDLLRR